LRFFLSQLEYFLMDKIKLTKRQVQILDLLQQGLTNVQLAEVIGISEQTIKVHVWRLFKRINVKNRGSAVAWWVKTGNGIETVEQAYARGVADGRQQILNGISKMADPEQGEQA
jgi:DNA-binding CsgD family transcriptional regulator